MHGRFMRTEAHQDRVVVYLAGEIDVEVAAWLRERLQDLVAAGQVDLVIELRAVTFVDSTGLGVLVGVSQATRTQGGSMALVVDEASPVAKILRVSALDLLFPVYASLKDALSK